MPNKDLPTLKDVSRVPEELLPVLRWWQDKGPKTLAYVVGVLVVAGALVFWFEQRRSGRAAAVAALAAASQVEDYEAIVALGTPAADVARLDLARSLHGAGDYEGALAVYDAVLGTLKEPALRDVAAVGRVCSLEALGRLDEALKDTLALEAAFAASAAPHYLLPELLLAKARILCQQGDKAAAKQALAPMLTAEEGAPLAKHKPQAERAARMIDAYVRKSLFDKAAEVTTAEAPAQAEVSDGLATPVSATKAEASPAPIDAKK